jgi:uncharacterized repeat protein (TIGR03803 family)
MKPIRLCMAATLAACLMTLFAAESSHAQTYKELYSFKGSPDGAFPYSGVIRDSKGNLYGTSPGGGIGNFVCGKLPCGVVFKVDSTGKETVLYSFCSQSNCSDGYSPSGRLSHDAKGNLIGTTAYGGTYGHGTVFKLSKTGKETVLYSFCSHPNSCLDGAYPNGELIQDSEGNLYGTTRGGGASNLWGTVFKLSKTGKETVLYSFCSTNNCADGAQPSWGVIQDAEGNLYGTTDGGGGVWGTVFKLSKTGKETVLHSFTGGPDGGESLGGLIQDLKGNLYGTSFDGGTYGRGNVFKLSREQNGHWKETVLYSFNGPDGYYPSSGVIQDAKRNLYGTTSLGGRTGCGSGGCGVVFELSSAGKETVLHSFTGSDGDNPGGGLVEDDAGNLYGVTGLGGDISCADGTGQGCGVVFKLSP